MADGRGQVLHPQPGTHHGAHDRPAPFECHDRASERAHGSGSPAVGGAGGGDAGASVSRRAGAGAAVYAATAVLHRRRSAGAANAGFGTASGGRRSGCRAGCRCGGWLRAWGAVPRVAWGFGCAARSGGVYHRHGRARPDHLLRPEAPEHRRFSRSCHRWLRLSGRSLPRRCGDARTPPPRPAFRACCLLDALVDLVEHDRAEAASCGFSDDEMSWLEDARRAIAKAKGG